MARKPSKTKQVETLTHEKARRRNIPTAELQAISERIEEMMPAKPVRYPRATPLPKGAVRDRDQDLDPQIIWKGMTITLTKEQRDRLVETGKVELGEAQLVWRGKDRQDWTDLVVNVPPIYVQEKVHPKALIDDLVRRSKAAKDDGPDLFADFNGLDAEAKTEFYEHDQHWSNRMILGDSLQVMASLAEREKLRGKVQAIYFDPPYGIRFNSNWQVSTRETKVTDGKLESLTREPEQVKAFRDTWKDGIHSYLTYLRDRLTVMRDLLTDSGSIFVQIGDENVHRVRAVLDEVFGEENFVSQISFVTTTSQTSKFLPPISDLVVWYARDRLKTKYRALLVQKDREKHESSAFALYEQDFVISRKPTGTDGERLLVYDNLTSRSGGGAAAEPFSAFGKTFKLKSGGWKTSHAGLARLNKAARLGNRGDGIYYVRYFDDFPYVPMHNNWTDTQSGGMGAELKSYVVQTNVSVIERCLLMCTDPGDLVLDPTCGSGTTAFVGEQWGRRWITIDTSRVALALARQRLMSAKYPYFFLRDSVDGARKEGEVTGKLPQPGPFASDVRQGFVFKRAPHIMLGKIANNVEIDVIWEQYQGKLEPHRAALNRALNQKWEEWEIPREADAKWPKEAKDAHAKWWENRIARQKEIDASIARAADVENLYDRPYEDKSRVRVAGPFTVESLSPHRVVPMDDDELLDEQAKADKKSQKKRKSALSNEVDFVQVILENLRTAGVQQTVKADRIVFTHITPWAGSMICAEGHFMEGARERRAAIMIGPEYGTLHRTDLMAAAREATEARFDILIACAFGYDAHASEVTKLGPLPIIKAKMNPDLHMAPDLKRDKNANLFMVIGEPDITITEKGEDLTVTIRGMDVFVPATGEIRHGDTKDIAAWFIDTDYDEESFFVRHAYFLGAGDPYSSLKTALRAEIGEDAWSTLYRDTSRPFPRPKSGRIAVKVINHYGDEVMKVFSV
jgi:adenine-specific DNA-methyltransferase